MTDIEQKPKRAFDLPPFRKTRSGDDIWHMGELQAILESYGVRSDDAAAALAFAFLTGARSYDEVMREKRGRRTRRILDVSQERWIELREEVFARDGRRCVYCGDRPPILHCDHIVPVSKGGKSKIDNLATACFSCNSSKGDLTPEEWEIAHGC